MQISSTMSIHKSLLKNYAIIIASIIVTMAATQMIYANMSTGFDTVVDAVNNKLESDFGDLGSKNKDELTWIIFLNNLRISLLLLLFVYPLNLFIILLSTTTAGIYIGTVTLTSNIPLSNVLITYLTNPFFWMEMLTYAMILTSTELVARNLHTDKKLVLVKIFSSEYRRKLKEKFVNMKSLIKSGDIKTKLYDFGDFMLWFIVGVEISKINKDGLRRDSKTIIAMVIFAVIILFVAAYIESISI